MVRTVSGRPGSVDIQDEKSTTELVKENLHICDDCGARFLNKRGLASHICDSGEPTDDDTGDGADDSTEICGDPPYFTTSVKSGFETYHTRRDCYQLQPCANIHERDERYLRFHDLSPCPVCGGGDG